MSDLAGDWRRQNKWVSEAFEASRSVIVRASVSLLPRYVPFRICRTRIAQNLRPSLALSLAHALRGLLVRRTTRKAYSARRILCSSLIARSARLLPVRYKAKQPALTDVFGRERRLLFVPTATCDGRASYILPVSAYPLDSFVMPSRMH
jgi:hypothetical protein